MAKRKFAGKMNESKAQSVEQVTYKFKGYPTDDVMKQLYVNINGCRGFWNILVSDNRFMYENLGYTIDSTPADYKGATEYEWLKGIDSIALSNVQLNFQKAMSAFYEGDSNLPKLKKKGRCKESYTTNLSNRDKPNLKLEGDILTLPKVKGSIRLNVHRKIKEGGLLKNCTVSHDATGWYFSLVFEYPKVQVKAIDTNDTSSLTHIGLDMSLPNLYVDSNGDTPDFIKLYRKYESRLAKEQRKLSRMLKANIDHYETRGKHKYPVYKKPLEECKNYNKQKAKVARLHARIKHMRNDMLHKLSAKLTDMYDVISIEDLNVTTIKKTLNFGKSASDLGWGNFTTMLQYKQERKGHKLVKVDRFFPSSKTCSHCGHIHKELQLSDRTYVCPKCGYTMDRDHQAAINIDNEGLRLLTA